MKIFDFQNDVFDFANDVNLPRQQRDTIVKSHFHHRCEGITRAWQKFWRGSRFIKGERVSLKEEKQRVRQILHRRVYLPPLLKEARLTLPGYDNLKEFSRIHVSWLPWLFNTLLQTHFYPGVQRMAYPFTRRGQQKEAFELLEDLAKGELMAVHVSRFPIVTINHFIICFSALETSTEIEFQAYDPNRPIIPIQFRFDKTSRWFIYPKTRYFDGGPVNANRAYRNFLW